MVKSFTSFLSQYERFQKIVSEYVSTYQYALSAQSSREATERSTLLRELQIIENEDRRKQIQLKNKVQEQLTSLRQLLYAVDLHERDIEERRYQCSSFGDH